MAGRIASRNGWPVSLAMACATLGVYLTTLAPTLTFRNWGADGGDLLAAARTLGIPHPPGYPTYTLIAWLATQLPCGSIAFRANLLSAICAACATGLVYLCVLSILPSGHARWLPAAVGALALGFCPLVWSQATITEVYAPALCAASLSLFLALRWRSGGRDSLLWASALVFGLSLGIHLTIAFAILPALVLLWPQRKRWTRPATLIPTLALAVTGLCIFAYLPLAARRQPLVNWGNPDNWSRLLWMVSGRLYGAMAFGLPAADIGARLSAWAGSLARQFAWGGWALALPGLPRLWKQDPALGAAGVLWVAIAAPFAFFFNSDDSHLQLLPTMIAPAVWLSMGVDLLCERTPRRCPRLRQALPALLLVPLASLTLNWRDLDLAADRSAEAYVNAALGAMEGDGLVLTQGDRPTFALWYAIYAEGQRQDVAVVNTTLLGFDWYRDQLRRVYPHIEVPEPVGQPISDAGLTRELVLRNYLGHRIYALDPSSEWQTWFDITQYKDAPVYRILVRMKWEHAP